VLKIVYYVNLTFRESGYVTELILCETWVSLRVHPPG